MPHNSKKNTRRKFKSEAEEADWYASPAGQRETEHEMEKAIRSGAAKVYPDGRNIKRTDPAVLAELLDDVKGRKTQAVSLRIPARDIEAAKEIAAKAGIGYQTVLKEIISKALRQAS